MKALVLALFLVSATLDASDAGDSEVQVRVESIQLELSALEQQKSALQRELRAEQRREMLFEMQGQEHFVESEWHDLGDSLKKAEAAEQKAHQLEADLNRIDQTLRKLKAERDLLMPKKSAH